MVTLEDVAAMAMELPEVTEDLSWGHRTWSVRKKTFVWERPFTKADIKRYGDEPVPQGELVGVRVEDLHEKEAVLAAHPKAFFTIAHFNNYPAVLVQLKKVGKRELRDAIVDAWLAVAPTKLAKEYVESHPSLQR